jgi:hypothetical protein
MTVPTPATSDEVVILSKLTLPAMDASPETIKRSDVNQEPLARVGGIARKVSVKVNKQTGDVHQGLSGDFIGVNLRTGKQYRSGILYLPSGIQEQVESALGGDDSPPVEFFIELRAVKAKNPAGYSYIAIALHRPEAVDPLDKFRHLAIKGPIGQPALPAPNKS